MSQPNSQSQAQAIELENKIKVFLENNLKGYIQNELDSKLDKHFDQLLQKRIGKQIENIKKIDYEQDVRERVIRVEEQLKHQGKILEKLIHQMGKRFEQVDKRFEEIQRNMDKRFEQVDKRFEQITKRLDRFMVWSFSLTITTAGIVVGLIKYL